MYYETNVLSSATSMLIDGYKSNIYTQKNKDNDFSTDGLFYPLSENDGVYLENPRFCINKKIDLSSSNIFYDHMKKCLISKENIKLSKENEDDIYILSDVFVIHKEKKNHVGKLYKYLEKYFIFEIDDNMCIDHKYIITNFPEDPKENQSSLYFMCKYANYFTSILSRQNYSK